MIPRDRCYSMVIGTRLSNDATYDAGNMLPHLPRLHSPNYAGVSPTKVPFLFASVRPSNSVKGAESRASIDLNSCIKRTITYELSVSANCSA